MAQKNVDVYSFFGGGGGLRKCMVCTHENVDIYGWPLTKFKKCIVMSLQTLQSGFTIASYGIHFMMVRVGVGFSFVNLAILQAINILHHTKISINNIVFVKNMILKCSQCYKIDNWGSLK